MSSTHHYLAIDLGAESGRVMLGRLAGRRLSVSEVHRFPNGPVRLPAGPDAVSLHWDVLRLWDEIKAGIALAVRQYGAPASIGVDAWGVDFALLDRHGALLANPHHYRDSRTDGMLAEAFRRMPRERIFELTGIQFLPINTLYQLLSLAMAGSPLLDVAEKLLTIPDLFNTWLTGEVGCELSNATTTQCYDVRQGAWADALLAAMEIPRRLFPRVIAPGSVLGSLRATVAEEVGAGRVPVVAPACHDTGSAVAAVPASGGDFAWISSGTWSILGVELPQPVVNAQSLAFNLTNEGGVGGTFRLSKNIMGLWLVQECRRAWAAEGQAFSYAELSEMASRAMSCGSVVDVDHAEFLKPGDMPARLAAFCRRSGQPAPADRGALLRCVLESIALKYRYVLEQIEAASGRRLDPIHIVGGGTQNRLLCQLTANATGRRVLAGPAEATALGNVMMQAVALGHIASVAEARAIVRDSCAPEAFEPAERATWDDAYARLLDVMRGH